jgi:hypothetical protein
VDLTVEGLQRRDEVSAPPTPDHPYALIDRMVSGRLDQLG